MKVYFTASARGTAEHLEQYKMIFDAIQSSGHQNLDKLVLNIDPNSFYDGNHEEQAKLYDRTIQLIKRADVVVLEVSVPSLSMGFVLHKALEMNKPVIALYQSSNSPFFVQGIENEKLQVIEYDGRSLAENIANGLDYAQEKSDVRFNFFISPAIGHYLDWVAKVKKIPRSVYLRNLIEKDMAKNEEYE